MSQGRKRSGFALPAAIAALVLLSTLVAGALFVATEELRSGRGDVADERSLALAEWGLSRAIADWSTQRNTAASVGEGAVIEHRVSGIHDTLDVEVTRVGRRTFWVTSRATSSLDGRRIPARRVVAASLRLVGPVVSRQAALTTAAGVTVTEGTIDGHDAEVGADTGLCDSTAAVAGVAVPDATLVCGEACLGEVPPGVTGVPPVTAEPSLTTGATGPALGDWTMGDLARRAPTVLAPGVLAPRPAVAGDTCVVDDPLNWGDPAGSGPCGNFVPVVRVGGDAELAVGAVGQGILVVDGTLVVGAGARFVGIVIASAVIVNGPGAEVVGAVFVTGAVASRVSEGGAVRYSSCAVRRAELGAARALPVPGRWWAELR